MSSDMDNGTHDQIPERSWSNPFTPGTWLHDHFEKIIQQNRDLIIIIDDFRGSRGTGKTIASLQLANGMDQHGTLTKEHASMEPEEIREAYSNLPKRSGICLDEGQIGASNRSAMSKTNQALREIASMGRVEEKYVVVNTPALEFIDKDLQKLADIWITMVRKGQGIVHALERQPYAGKLLTPKKQRIEFEDIPRDHDLRDVYNALTRQKRKKIRGEGGGGFIPREEHTKKLEKAKKEVAKETRNRLIHDVYTHPEVEASQRVVGEAAGVSQKTVSNVIERVGGDQ